jgi:hypothetical protein
MESQIYFFIILCQTVLMPKDKVVSVSLLAGFEMPIKATNDLGKFLYKRNHQPLKRIFPLITMRFDFSSFQSNQMGNLMNQGNQKLIFIEI